MSARTWESTRATRRRFYRDRENGWLFGVCAGLSDFFGFRTGTVRLLAVVSVALFFWPTVLVYAAATLLFREKPLTYSGHRREQEFWGRHDRYDTWSRQ